MSQQIRTILERVKEMRSVYDGAVSHWKQLAVPYHRYQEFGVIFDRDIPWSGETRVAESKAARPRKGEASGQAKVSSPRRKPNAAATPIPVFC